MPVQRTNGQQGVGMMGQTPSYQPTYLRQGPHGYATPSYMQPIAQQRQQQGGTFWPAVMRTLRTLNRFLYGSPATRMVGGPRPSVTNQFYRRHAEATRAAAGPGEDYPSAMYGPW